MARVELNIVALGDFTSVNTQIKALQAQIDLLNKSVAGVGLGNNLTKDLNSAAAAFKNTMLSTGQFTQAQVQLRTETQKFGQALESGKLSLGTYYSIIKQNSGSAMNSVKALAVEQTKLQNSVIMADPTKQGFYSVFTPTTINKVADATKIAANEQNIYNIAVEKGTQSLINWGKNTQWAGRQLTVGMSVPLMLFASQATSAFKDVNTELTRLQRLYGEGLTPPSQAELNQISAQVTDLGKNVASSMGIAVKDTVQVAANFAAMGRQGQNLLDTTYQAQRLSKLGAVDATAATNTIVALQNVYKVSTNQLADAVNFLSDIQKQTTMTLGDMTEAIPRVGPIMQQLGGTYKDTAVMLVAMREAGIPAAQAANAVKSAIASLIAPTKSAVTAAQQFGISLDSVKNAGSPVQMIEKLQEGLKGLTPLAKEQVIEKIFGKFQFARVSALLDNFGKIGSQTQNALKIAGASSAELANLANQEMQQATSSPTAKYQRAIETFKADLIPVGQKIIEITTTLMNFGNTVAKIFSGLPGPIKSILGIAAIGTVLAGPIIMLTGLMANFIGYITKAVFNLKQLATGGTTLKQLLTPEIIASQQAADLFSKGILGDVDSVDLLNQAIKNLTISMEGLVSTMNAGTGISAIASEIATIAEPGLAGGRVPFIAPGMATGGWVPGNPAAGDVYPAMLTGQEAVIPAATAKKYEPFINGMLKGNLPGYEKGYSAGHTSMPFTAGSTQYEEMMRRYPSLVGLQETNPGSVRVLSNLVNTSMMQKLNAQLRSGTATPEQFAAGFGNTGGLGFARSAGLGGLASNPENIQALKDFEAELKKRVLALNKTTLSDEDLAKETRKLIDEQINAAGASKEVATALHNASQQVGQVRVNPGAEYIRSGIASGSLTQKGTLAYLNESPVGQIRNKGGKITDYAINQPGGYQTSTAKNIASSIEERIAQDINAESKSQSPSKATRKAAKNMVDGAVLGLEEGKAKVQETSATIGQSVTTTIEEETLGKSGAPNGGLFGKLKGMATNESGKMNIQSKMALSGGLMMGGSMLAGMLPKGSNVANITQSTSSMAGMGAMFGPWGMAAGAALGLVTGGIGALMKAEKEHAETVKATFTASTQSIQLFGGSVTDTTPRILHMADAISGAGITSKKIVGEINQLTDAISKLDKGDPLKKTADAIKGYDTVGGIVGTLKQFAAAQVAAGMDPAGVQKMVAAMLQYAGKTQYLNAALKEIIPATRDLGAAQETLLQKTVSLANAQYLEMQANQGAISAYKDLNSQQKTVADAFGTVATSLMSATAKTSDMKSAMYALNQSGLDAYTSGKILSSELTQMGEDKNFVANFNRINGVVKDTGTALLISTAQAMGLKTGLDNVALTKLAADPKALKQLADDLKAANDAANALAKKTTTSTTTTSSTSTTDPVTALTAKYSKLVNLENKRISDLEKTNKLMNDQNQAAKDAVDLASQQTDLQNQIRQAMASGDYLKANLLRQNMMANQDTYNQTITQNANQQTIDTLKQQLADFNDQIANKIDPGLKAAKAMVATANTTNLKSYQVGSVTMPSAMTYGSAAQMGTAANSMPQINVVVNANGLTADQAKAVATGAVSDALTKAGITAGASARLKAVGTP